MEMYLQVPELSGLDEAGSGVGSTSSGDVSIGHVLFLSLYVRACTSMSGGILCVYHLLEEEVRSTVNADVGFLPLLSLHKFFDAQLRQCLPTDSQPLNQTTWRAKAAH